MKQRVVNSEPRMIFGFDVRLYSDIELPDIVPGSGGCSLCSLVLCHNHPSGTINPSIHDINVTKRLADAGRLLDQRGTHPAMNKLITQ